MGPETPLPLNPTYFPPGSGDTGGANSADDFVTSLLEFGTQSSLLRTLCGGVHILDFFTREPPLYPLVVPASWRKWFRDQDVLDVLELLMRRDLGTYDGVEGEGEGEEVGDGEDEEMDADVGVAEVDGGPAPPASLIKFIHQIRKHSLARDFSPPAPPAAQKGQKAQAKAAKLPRHVAVGMKVKKIHEVEHFARFVDSLSTSIQEEKGRTITHVADFGSGQNYLGRALASKPYDRHVIAIEGRPHNIVGAKEMDVMAGLAPKKKKIVNKKEWRKIDPKRNAKRAEREGDEGGDGCADCETPKEGDDQVDVTPATDGEGSSKPLDAVQDGGPQDSHPPAQEEQEKETQNASDPAPSAYDVDETRKWSTAAPGSNRATLQTSVEGQGSIQYVEYRMEDGNLAPVVEQILDPSKLSDAVDSTELEAAASSSQPFAKSTQTVSTTTKATDPNLMVVSIHSCGNLSHHGIRSLTLNPTVKAIAMVGCCYNLVTERLGPPSYKLPTLRPNHPRLEQTANAFDPHGFPMSERMARHRVRYSDGGEDEGVRLNITARMMAVQAPQNWGAEDSAAFFTRHFFRALLQRIFFERGVVGQPKGADDVVGGRRNEFLGGVSPAGCSSGTVPIVIGGLKKSCYESFTAYVRGATAKILAGPEDEGWKRGFEERMGGLTDEEIGDYEVRYAERKKELSVVWALMAFSAGVVEAMIVVDRWLWLREQEEVESCWVESVFDYKLSPRNLVVVGIKK